MRERILLAALISHPALADHVEERLGGMSFADSRLDSLRQSALMHIAQNPQLDFVAFRAHLANLGFAEELENLLNSDIYLHAGFARADASLEEAAIGWDHTFRLCQRADLEADLNRALEDMTENPSDETLAAYTALRALVHPPGDEDGDELAFDETSHHKR
jgi:DNA primase